MSPKDVPESTVPVFTEKEVYQIVGYVMGKLEIEAEVVQSVEAVAATEEGIKAVLSGEVDRAA